MQYVAIDFETASRRQDSACSIGLVRMDEEAHKLDSFYSLICPPDLIFDPECTNVHHLDPLVVKEAPEFYQLWDEICAFIGNDPLVAHNATFDIGVLRAMVNRYDLKPLYNDYYCTLSLARKLWKGKPSYKLTYLASEFGWTYDAHNALADAEVCGRLFAKLCGISLFDEEVMRRFFKRIYKNSDNAFPRKVEMPKQSTIAILSP